MGHGHVTFADPTNEKYPLENAGHVRSAWCCIDQERNADSYSTDEVKSIRERIRQVAKMFDVEVSPD